MIEIRYIFDLDNKPVNEYTINNGKYQISAINIGAAITKIIVPNQNDKLENITLRYYDYKAYKNNDFLLGTLIDYRKFLENKKGQLNYYFDCELEENTIVFKYKNNDQYIHVKYSLLDHHFLIEYDTNTDLLLSNVLFFNLTGNLKKNVKCHEVLIGDQLIDLSLEIDDFSTIHTSYQVELATIKLIENGISLSIDSNERSVSLSYGKQFNKDFKINKEMEADHYSGIGIVVGGNQFNRYVNYEFKQFAKYTR